MSSYIKATYEYTKLRKTFGRQPLFQVVPAHMLDSISPSIEDQKMYGLRNPVHRGAQAVTTMSENEVNTPKTETREYGMNHEEGGWPREVNPTIEEHTERHRRRVLHDEGFCETIQKLGPSMMHCIDQNNAIDMYQTYFSNIRPQEPVEKYNIRISNVFRDKEKRPISSVKFTNESNSKIVVAYGYKTCMPDPSLNTSNMCCLWDVLLQTEPLLKIYPEFPCWQLACSPVSPELIICGLENGTVNLFDIRADSYAVASSPVLDSHRESVTSIRYIHSRTHTDFFSGSSDGQCLWWDARNLSEPLDKLPMSIRITRQDTPNLGNAEGISFLEYDYGFPTKFLCGTSSGLIIIVNRMGKSHSEKLVSYLDAHDGPVQAIERSSCTNRMFLSCGDYTVRIWSEEIRTAPIIVFNPYRYLVTDACWSPSRYSCYMSICEGGNFYYWDLLRKYKEPIKTLYISDYALTKMSPHSSGASVAIGDCQGSVYLLELSENMATSGNHDKALMQQIYERETKREHILDNRLKEIRLKARMEEEQARIEVEESIADEEPLRIAEEEYFKIVQEELINMEMTTDQNVE